jgi:hypothetical protein
MKVSHPSIARTTSAHATPPPPWSFTMPPGHSNTNPITAAAASGMTTRHQLRLRVPAAFAEATSARQASLSE